MMANINGVLIIGLGLLLVVVGMPSLMVYAYKRLNNELEAQRNARVALKDKRIQSVRDLHPNLIALDIESNSEQYVAELDDHSVIAYTFENDKSKPIFKEKRK